MAYTVLARRYRSQEFDEVIGQEPIARTLRNAIATNRVAHAYLFCGTRGVGKTTSARLFAKALNGGTAEIDKAIMEGTDIDVIEIDGASTNKVEDARELIGNSIYAPMRGKYKVYIIDEVHMLTTQAFNALLKTMEEPPAHVKFILCTTDPHKVPATIQSRCQRFDFRAIPATLIAKHLTAVLKKEKYTADPELVHQVAVLGNGSMRDALTLLDRLIASGEKHLTVKLLEELLGLPDRVLVTKLIEAFCDGEPGAALDKAGQLLEKGISIDQLLETLLGRLRDLMVMAACGEQTTLVELSDEARSQEGQLAKRFDAAGLTHMIALCENVQRAAKNSAVPRAMLDALLVRLSMAEKLADVAALLEGKPQPMPAARGGSGGGGAGAKKR